jgi:hypothetical protein
MQIYHLHEERRRLPVISVLIQAAESSGVVDGHNEFLQEAIDAFQYEYDSNKARCATMLLARRRLLERDGANSTVTSSMDSLLNTTFGSFEELVRYGNLLNTTSEFQARKEEHGRRLSKIWSPYHESLMPTYYFYGYDGSLTEPPCTGMFH